MLISKALLLLIKGSSLEDKYWFLNAEKYLRSVIEQLSRSLVPNI